MSGSAINSSSGQFQAVPIPTVQWVDPKTGMPTSIFYGFVRSLWLRTGGNAAPAGNGLVGLTFLEAQVDEALAEASQALRVATIAALDTPDVPPPDIDTTTGGGSSGPLAVDVVTPADLGPPPYALAKAWFLGA